MEEKNYFRETSIYYYLRLDLDTFDSITQKSPLSLCETGIFEKKFRIK